MASKSSARAQVAATNGCDVRLDITADGLKVSILKGGHFRGVAVVGQAEAAELAAILAEYLAAE